MNMIVFVHLAKDAGERLDDALASKMVTEAMASWEGDKGDTERRWRSWSMSTNEPEEFGACPWASVAYVRAAHIGPPAALITGKKWLVTRPLTPIAAAREVAADTYWRELARLDPDDWIVSVIVRR